MIWTVTHAFPSVYDRTPAGRRKSLLIVQISVRQLKPSPRVSPLDATSARVRRRRFSTSPAAAPLHATRAGIIQNKITGFLYRNTLVSSGGTKTVTRHSRVDLETRLCADHTLSWQGLFQNVFRYVFGMPPRSLCVPAPGHQSVQLYLGRCCRIRTRYL